MISIKGICNVHSYIMKTPCVNLPAVRQHKYLVVTFSERSIHPSTRPTACRLHHVLASITPHATVYQPARQRRSPVFASLRAAVTGGSKCLKAAVLCLFTRRNGNSVSYGCSIHHLVELHELAQVDGPVAASGKILSQI